MFFDPTMVLLIPGIILAMYAQGKVQATYHKYVQVMARGGYTGAQVARRILDDNGLENVAIELTPGN